MDKDKIHYRKIEILKAREEKRITQKQLERRCFWTHPFGHVWPEEYVRVRTCLICGKHEFLYEDAL